MRTRLLLLVTCVEATVASATQMKIKLIVTAVLLALLGGLPSPAFAADPVEILSDIDPSALQLPAHFRGASIEQVMAGIAQAPRGEFETTAQYKARMTPKSARIYGFVVDVDHTVFKYSPDTQAFLLRVLCGYFGSPRQIMDAGAIVIKDQLLSKREYVASNAFGAKVLATAENHRVYAIEASRYDVELIESLNYDRHGRDSAEKFHVSVPLEKAPSAKASLRAMLIVHLDGAADSVHSFMNYSEAMIADPLKGSWEFNNIKGDLLAVWVYDFETGKIYLKKNLRSATGESLERIQSGKQEGGRQTVAAKERVEADNARKKNDKNIASEMESLNRSRQARAQGGPTPATSESDDAISLSAPATKPVSIQPRTPAEIAWENADWNPAFLLYSKSAEAGDADAQVRVGRIYYDGLGRASDFRLAEQWYRKAVAKGNAEAKYRLGILYSEGRNGAPWNLDMARQFFMEAAETSPEAAAKLGSFYWNGIGVPEDKEQARKWYQRGAKLGSGEAADWLRAHR